MKKTKLIPADLKRCQAEVPNTATFLTFGDVPGRMRCRNKPSVIAKEVLPGEGGRRGSMSLCNRCLDVALKQLGHAKFSIKYISLNSK